MAMLKNKHIIFSFILVCLSVVSPLAKGQLGLGGILGGGGPSPNIEGVLFCTLNGSPSLNIASTPVFANADLQLQCGRQNTVVSNTTTNSAGIFSIPTNGIQMSLSNCNLTVATPLSNCNPTLPSDGSRVSQLTFGASVFARTFIPL